MHVMKSCLGKAALVILKQPPKQLLTVMLTRLDGTTVRMTHSVSVRSLLLVGSSISMLQPSNE